MPHFVDTNVFLYARDSSDPAKQQRAGEWVTHLWATLDGRISTQVLTEFYVSATRKLTMSVGDSRADVRDLQAWAPITHLPDDRSRVGPPGPRLGFVLGHALILAAAAEAGCQTVLTDDLSHGATYGDVTVVDPFQQAPAAAQPG